MKKLIAITVLILSGLAVMPTLAQTPYPQDRWSVQNQDRNNKNNRRNRDRRWENRRNDNAVVVKLEQRYIRVGRKVYREVYRSTYTRYGQLVNRVLVRRERLSRYDRYRDDDFRREGIRFGIHISF